MQTIRETWAEASRITLCEVLIMEALTTSLTNYSGAVAALNIQIKNMDETNLPAESLHPRLWYFAQALLSGRPLQA